MDCPKGHGALEHVAVGSIKVDRCTDCGGTWYDAGELRLLKDKQASGDYRWIDFDLWKDRDQFRANRQERYKCPSDGHSMTSLHYGESQVVVDMCPECRGLWLDRHEFQRIVAYLEEMVNSKSVGDYLADIRDEFVDIFVGPENPLSELKDFGRVLYLLQLRFVLEHRGFEATLRSLPRF